MTAAPVGPSPPPSPSQVVAYAQLRAYCCRLLLAGGFTASSAELIADSLTDAEARGVHSHGIQRTRIYVERMQAGLLDATAVPAILKETPGSVLLDAGNAPGHVGAQAGIDMAIDRAERGTVCTVGVRNSNHCGTLAYFARQATKRGMIAIAASNAPPTMVFFGGRSRAVGTNPLAIAVPTADDSPLVLDMATSATARGRIILADQLDQAIPADWAVDETGQPTTDVKAALRGAVLPFAGPKGSGLAMMIDLLCGALMAGVTGDLVRDMYEDWEHPQRVSHLFIVIDPDAFIGRKAFLEHVTEFVERVRNLSPAAGFDRVYFPGEIEAAAFRGAWEHGVAVPETLVEDLHRLAGQLGVSSLDAPARSPRP